MRFFADESCDYAIVRALRSEGHDITAAAESARSTADESILRQAAKEHRSS
ncbi:MAG: DUF5615 family PIN-like protein [Planctomycetes bacterium]|nr:DUF5615 family PIN-like protein [Planctomycetota bacterium]